MKLDRILDSIFVIKSFYENTAHDIEKTSHMIDVNWVEIKLLSLDALLLAPEAKRVEELTKRNLHLHEISQSMNTKILSLEETQLNLTVRTLFDSHNSSLPISSHIIVILPHILSTSLCPSL